MLESSGNKNHLGVVFFFNLPLARHRAIPSWVPPSRNGLFLSNDELIRLAGGWCLMAGAGLF
jgi:hypothetical protein